MAPTQHGSWFTYHISRPYPFRWFTPIAITGLVVLTLLLTFLNFVTTGFTLVNEESFNPNATVTEGAWLPSWPSWIVHKVKPTCESVNLPVGSQFFTNQTALTYTLTDVWQPNTGAGFGEGISPTLTYHNNILENCTVNTVELDYSAMDRSAVQFAYSEYGVNVRTYATCAIESVNGSTMLNMTQEYDYVPEDVSFAHIYQFLGTNFLSRDAKGKASLYWGESLMSMYWAYSTKQMADIRADQTRNGNPGIRKGIIYFYRNTDDMVTNMTQANFFEVDFRFIVDEGRGNYSLIEPTTYGAYEEYTQLPVLESETVYPDIWEGADYLAKAAYSTVLTDLGRGSPGTPNILTNEEYLKFFTSNFTETKRNISNAYPGPTEFPYGTVNTGPLGTTPSVISTKYLCEVPRRKPGGDIFVSVLVADLVFLYALWLLWTKGVSLFFLEGRDHAEVSEPVAYKEVVAPASMRPDSPVEQMEMGDFGRGRDQESLRSRSESQERLVRPKSMDISHGEW